MLACAATSSWLAKRKDIYRQSKPAQLYSQSDSQWGKGRCSVYSVTGIVQA
jgi:hypothetical protein